MFMCRLSDALKPARGDISLAPRLHKTSVDVLAARHNSHSQSFNLGQHYKKVQLGPVPQNHLLMHLHMDSQLPVCIAYLFDISHQFICGLQDAEAAKEAISQRCSRPAEFRERCQGLTEAGYVSFLQAKESPLLLSSCSEPSS